MNKNIKARTEENYRYIYRNETGQFWWCALPYVDEGGKKRQLRKCFRDRRYRNQSMALRAALAWRNEEMDVMRLQGTMMPSPRLRRVPVGCLGDLSAKENAFGIVGITVNRRNRPWGINVSVTAQRGRKKLFSMRRYGAYEAFRMGVRQRCEWIRVPVPREDELRRRFDHWLQENAGLLDEYDIRT
tara:strand:+ start:1269 stop:1826 length:558 start_codon:yes stop_codon:yes gene_type:complete